VLQTSEACCRLFVERGTTKLTVAEIADGVGVSQRTFYRYFPTKAQTVEPVFAWTTAAFNDVVASAPAATVRDLLRAGFATMLGGEQRQRTRDLFPLVFADDEMWSVFLRAVHRGERTLTPLLAARSGRPPTSVAARAASATVAAATRVALEGMVADGTDPEDLFLDVLDACGSGGLFDSPAEERREP
jgi:AcrR family transcriptional regulator